MKLVFLIIFIGFSLSSLAQGPYAPDADTQGTTAIHYQDVSIKSWATSCEVTRGYLDIANPSLGLANFGTNTDGVGSVGSNGIVSLGDGGEAILTFSSPIINEPGYDFAVFENSFSNTFLELAHVEVSSDGINYVRFPSVSLTQTITQIDGFGDVDPTNIYNLAGKYRAQYGTPFDLEEVKNEAGLDVNNITHIKLIDAVGSINPSYAQYDSQGNMINDPYSTPFGSGGFDLDAVGVISTVLSVEEEIEVLFNIYPNPSLGQVTISTSFNSTYDVLIYDLSGRLVFSKTLNENSSLIDLSDLNKGSYSVSVKSKYQTKRKLIILN